MTYEEEIIGYREEINRLNEEILVKLKDRVAVAKAIAELKRRYGKPVRDKARERVVLDQVRVYSLSSGLDPEGVERAFQAIIDLCVEAEEKV